MKNIYFLLLITFLFSCKTLPSNSQETKINKKAVALYDQSMVNSFPKNIDAAISGLEQAIKIEPNYYKALDALAQIYQSKQIDYKKAIIIHNKIIAFKPDAIKIFYNKALCEYKLKDFDNATRSIQSFLAFEQVKGINKLKGQQILSNINFSKKELLKENKIDFINLGKGINSSFDEYFPSVTSDNQSLYFTMKDSDNNYATEDIYTVENKNGIWQNKKALSRTINTEANEGAHCISSNGKYLLFSSDNYKFGNQGRFDIFISKKIGDNWRTPNNMGKNINSTTWDSQPVLSADSRKILFVSTKKGGFGGSDIYISTIDETGKFGEAKNIGDEINTPFDEQRPYLHPDGKTLYFSSAGHPGMGGNDLFKSTLGENGNWSSPKNLGYPINTSGEELGIFVSTDGTTAYVSSDREGGYGGQDIYSFKIPEEIKPQLVSFLKGKVIDKNSKNSIKANIKLFDLETGELFKSFSSDDENGNFLETITAGKDYALVAEAKDYLPFSKNFSLKDLKTNQAFEFNVLLQKIEKGNEINLKNIFFKTNSSELLETSKIELDFLVNFLKNNSNLLIEIGGHTDNIGNNSLNYTLSENRAKSVLKYLVSKNIDSKRLVPKGYGATKAIDTNDTKEGRANNRRTSFTIL